MATPRKSEKGKKGLLDEMKEAVSEEEKPFVTEKGHLTEEDLEDVSGACACRCGYTMSCSGGGSGQTLA